jgi:signal transduction histidine kinase
MPISGDAKLLFLAFSNLISNAVKYSSAGGLIEVKAEMAADDAVIAVADQGIGIPAADRAGLFERYHRGSNVSGIVGTGLGLHLVKMVSELHGGRVDVQSEQDRGACFTIRLPLRRAAAEPGPSPPALRAAAEAPPLAATVDSMDSLPLDEGTG